MERRYPIPSEEGCIRKGEKLGREYAEGFRWGAILQEIEDNKYRDHYSCCSDGELRGTCFIGTVFSIMPSGKYYTPWACSNVTELEALHDEGFTSALEEVAGEYGLYLESGEGDPCDLFFGKTFEEDEDYGQLGMFDREELRECEL